MTMMRLPVFCLTLAIASAAYANPVTLNSAQRDVASAALDQRLACAAYYRYSLDIIRRRPTSPTNVRMAFNFDHAGKNMLVQASAIGGSLGSNKLTLARKFQTALSSMRKAIDNRADNYNRVARRLHTGCTSLIVSQ